MPKKPTSEVKKPLTVVATLVLIIVAAFFVVMTVNRQETPNPQSYVGLTKSEAIEKVQSDGLDYFILEENTKTEDIPAARANLVVLVVSNGRVEKAGFSNEMFVDF